MRQEGGLPRDRPRERWGRGGGRRGGRQGGKEAGRQESEMGGWMVTQAQKETDRKKTDTVRDTQGETAMQSLE